MIREDAAITAPAPVRAFRFDRFVLDVDAGFLLRDGSEIPLRPKTLAVLRHLVENPGRLISKDELFASVWGGVAVTDDVLVQSIGELRRALGDDGVRLLKTVPRRGYRLDAACEPAAGRPLPGAQAVPSPQTGVVARFSGMRVGPVGLLLVLALIATAATFWIHEHRASPASSGDVRPAASVEITGRPPIAILPFQDHDGASSRAYFAEGLTQDVINALGRFSALTVMSWNAVLPFKSRPAPPAEIGAKLAVRYYVEGRVQQIDGRVRLSAELVGTDGRVLWSERFDEALTDVLTLPDKLVTRIAGALAIRVTDIEQQRALTKPAASLEAYDSVLRARPALQRPTRAGIVEARSLLRRAIDIDANYAAAHSALAQTYYVDVSMGWAQSPAAALARAEELANTALRLDATDVRARVILGRIHIFHHRYEQAGAELDRAVAINPSDAQAIAGRGNIQMWLGQADASIAALELAQRIDPNLNAIDTFALSLAYYLKGRYVASIERALQNIREAQDANFSRAVLAAAYAQSNRADEALQTARELMSKDPTFDPGSFGSKLQVPADLAHLRDGFRKAGL